MANPPLAARLPCADAQGAAPRGGHGSAAGPDSGGGNGYLQSQPTSYVSRMGVADTEITAEQSGRLDPDADGSKYVRRQTSIQRTLKRVFPSLFQGGGSLPITTK